jgi:hypothetical protein
MYYMSFPKDRNSIKALVFGLFIVETAQTVLVTHDLFAAYASGWGNLSQLASAHLEWFSTPILSGVVSCTVQLFFAYRISVLAQSKILGCGIALIALTQGVSAIVQGIQAAIINDFAKLQTEARVSVILWLGGSALCDIVIAVFLCYYLSQTNTSFKATRVLLNRIIRLTIETGSLTATVATVDLILFFSFPNNNYHTTPALTIAKLYTNSLVLTFNSRMRVIGGRDETHTSDLLELRTTRITAPGVASVHNTVGNVGVAPIRITRTTDVVGDVKNDWDDRKDSAYMLNEGYRRSGNSADNPV